MASPLEITVGPKRAQLVGSDHLALQAAVDYVATLGGGTVRVLPGTYEMGNSLFLRSGVRVVGAGEDTILRKPPSAKTKLTEDLDWYDTVVPVKDPSIFRVGGGLLLRGKSPHTGAMQVVKRTVTAIHGRQVHIDRDTRMNFWIVPCIALPEGVAFEGAEAATLYPIISGDHVRDIAIESLTIDGNRAANEHLDGNHAGGIFVQDCERITVREVTSRDNHGDGISWQVSHDVTIENCRLLNNADLGLHPGSGSQRPVIRGNVSRGNDTGLYFCWGVKDGIAEDNVIEHSGRIGLSIGHRDTDNLIRNNIIRRSGLHGVLLREHPHAGRDPHRNVFEGNVIEDSGRIGLSIGHRDTDNLIRNNVIRRSGLHGVLLREHPHPGRDPHRNVFEGNVIEDSGKKGECVAVEMLGRADGVVLRGNAIRDTRRKLASRTRIGLRLHPGLRKLTLLRNDFSGLEVDMQDLREEPGTPARR